MLQALYISLKNVASYAIFRFEFIPNNTMNMLLLDEIQLFLDFY